MEKNSFQAKSWIKSRGGPLPYSVGPDSSLPYRTNLFNPQNYLVPGWDGQSLISKSGIKLRRLFQLVREDVKKQMIQAPFNQSLKVEVYQEFLAYAENLALECSHIDSLSAFFHHLHWAGSPHAKELTEFKNTFATRVATIYLFKIRFLTKLSQTLKQKIYPTYLLNPNSYFAKLFRKGSSSQLASPGITANHYSWYRPKVNLISDDFNIVQIYEEVSIAESQKIFSLNNQRPSAGTGYSHTLSHLNFGLFLMQLMTEFPLWIGKTSSQSSEQFPSLLCHKVRNVLTAQYCGDHLDSLALSHWLAQNQLHHPTQKFIICPEFHGPQHHHDIFTRLTYELQFLCLLTDIAQQSHSNPISFICDTYRLKENSKQVLEGQQPLFNQAIIQNNNWAYDRIILNLTQFPRNNPHHFLMNRIQAKVQELKANGLLIVLSAKKLFIPSLSERVEELLKDFKLESALTFEKLKGRGEIAPYLYILSKRNEIENRKLSLSGQLLIHPVSLPNEGIQKHPCLSFRISGDLKIFGRFTMINQAFKEFFKNKKPNTTPIYQRELSEGLAFEFYQDAMVDGKLINTTNKDTSKITHPNFFKNLMRSCYPMNYFFQIEQIPTGAKKIRPLFSQDLLGISLEPEDKYRYILILDYRNKSLPRLEFVPSNTFKSKRDEYGQALCSYFGLIPKIKNININLFRYFFKTQLGHQIFHLSLNDGFNKLKAKVGSILVPKFFEQDTRLPQHVEEGLLIYHYPVKQLLRYDSHELQRDYFQIEKLSLGLAANYPWHIMGLLVLFEQKLDTAGDEIWIHENCFENKTFINSLVKYPTRPLYPDNPEVFVKFHIQKAQELHFPFKHLSIAKANSAQKEIHGLKLHSNQGEALSLYSHKNLIKFLEFILTKTIGKKVTDILNYTKVPGISDLNQLIEKQREIGEALLHIKSANQKLLSRLINQQLY